MAAWKNLVSITVLLLQLFGPRECAVFVTSAQIVAQNARPEVSPLMSSTEISLHHCVLFCQKNEECLSFAFENIDSQCDLFDDDFLAGSLMQKMNSTFYRVSRKASFPLNAVTRKKKKSYEIFEEYLPFKEAEEYCKKLGGMLACIPDQETQKDVQTVVRLHYPSFVYLWIGIQAKAKPGPPNQNHTVAEFTHCLDGTDLRGFSNWRFNQPNNCLGKDVGVQILTEVSDTYSFGKWYDDNADFSFPFLCEYDTA